MRFRLKSIRHNQTRVIFLVASLLISLIILFVGYADNDQNTYFDLDIVDNDGNLVDAEAKLISHDQNYEKEFSVGESIKVKRDTFTANISFETEEPISNLEITNLDVNTDALIKIDSVLTSKLVI